MRLVLVGNYGVGNMGDEALRSYFIASFPEVQWSVLSACPLPGELPRLPFGIRSLLRTPWWRTIRAIRASEGVVFGGGTLFTDVESVRACWLWWWHVLIAALCGRPVFFAFQGVGPWTTRVGEWLTRWSFTRAAFISVRDDGSFRRLSSLLKNTIIVQTFDPAITQIEEKKDGVRTNSLFVIPRANSGSDLLDAFAKLYASRTWETVTIVHLQPQDAGERSVAQSLRGLLREGQECTVRSCTTMRELGDMLRNAGHVLTHRFHGGLAALMVGASFTAVHQDAGDKLAQLAGWQQEGSGALRARVAAGEIALRQALAANVIAPSASFR